MWYYLIIVLVLQQELRCLYLFLLLICTDELISGHNIMNFCRKLLYVNENSERESNPMAQPLYSYQSRSAFLVSFTDPKKQLFN